jgi:hypothetical protein
MQSRKFYHFHGLMPNRQDFLVKTGDLGRWDGPWD